MATALIKAIYALHAHDKLVPVVEWLVKNEVNIGRTTDYGEFPLGVSSRLGRFEVVRHLLEAGADPSQPTVVAPVTSHCEGGWSPGSTEELRAKLFERLTKITQPSRQQSVRPTLAA